MSLKLPPGSDFPSNRDFDFEHDRRHMVETHLKGRDIADNNVLTAMQRVPRHEFIMPSYWDEAYADHPLVIGCGQTISQPYIVAYMTQLLQVEPGIKVLEIGTGSGYQTAILAELGADVYSIERHEPLTEQAAEVLEHLGYLDNVTLSVCDGTLGWPEEAPFDRIIVTAVAPELPEPLIAQLSSNGGRMVVPVGESAQKLKIIEKNGDNVAVSDNIPVVFVKLIGENGF